MHIKFYVPRALDDSEYLSINLTEGIYNYNLDIKKLSFQLIRLTNDEEISVSVKF